MKSQKDWDNFYLKIAHEVAQMSQDPKTKVGCVVVKYDNIVAFSYNGTLRGSCNQMRDEKGETLDTVIHAEMGAIAKMAAHGLSAFKATMYCTRAPCVHCAKLVAAAGISTVVYSTDHSCSDGVEYLRTEGINVLKR